ncbi:glycosyltransferase [Chryseolinea sp. H1M3-3]|uniref:glycosyltransferase family 4 protein n=1 Tax=Chryseolinea sp. H1M3-3 TaxID=3034144 RepID=UPI0023EC6328|nr:glycosyltransferase [Chryseolinea sp. H1M3-3]
MGTNTIVFLDKEDFSFQDINEKPLAGAQSAFIELVQAFRESGFYVIVRNNCLRPYTDASLDWQHFSVSEIPKGDLYIVNRSTSLLPLVPKGKKILFWLHNEGKYLVSPVNLKSLIRRYPTLVFSGLYHRSTFPLWFLFRHRVIPYGISTKFLHFKKAVTPARPKVIFTSNPLRSLDWLMERWKVIHAKVPKAELHVFSGPATYGSWGNSVADRMKKVLDQVKSYESHGVILREPIRKDKLVEEIKTSRSMFYRGDKAETFCLAIAEVQAMGLPCVVQDLGSMKERIVNGVTGFVTTSDKEFEDRAIAILSDDKLWMEMNQALITGVYYKTWKQSAEMFMA